MKTFTIRDLRERTGELVRNAEVGHLALVAKHGHPLFVAVPLSEQVLRQGVGVGLACKLFAENVLSLGKAARMAKLSNEAFIEQLGAFGVPAVDYPEQDLEREMQVLSS